MIVLVFWSFVIALTPVALGLRQETEHVKLHPPIEISSGRR